jgi:hypothetical protein
VLYEGRITCELSGETLTEENVVAAALGLQVSPDGHAADPVALAAREETGT